MRLVFRRLRRGRGPLRLVPESGDDLYHLRHLVEPGDRVSGWTTRRSPAPGADRARATADRLPVRISLEAEGTEFHPSATLLRIPGKIVEPRPEGVSGGHHTLTVAPFDEVEIEKEWRSHHLDRLASALEGPRASVLLVTLEEGLAVAGELRAWGVEEKFTVEMGYGKGPGRDSLRGEFFRQVAEFLGRERAETIVLAGPGFAKEDLLARLRERHPAVAARAVAATCRSAGPTGFNELLRTGAVERVVKVHRLAEEAKLIDALLTDIARESRRAVYGAAPVEAAAARGAVESLLVADDAVRGREGLMEAVEKAGGRVTVFSGEAEPGKRLKGLGGIAALLRFSV
ncbi:MAG: mRNA surveillance protein pelota [Halobacteria archaeon]